MRTIHRRVPVRTHAVTLRSIVIVCAFAFSGAVLPQQWPTKPVRLIVPNPPGGIADSAARVTSTWLSGQLGQSVVVENRAGASGAIASEYVVKSAPDGYTLFFATMAQIAIVPAMRKTAYDPVKDFVPIGLVGSAVHVLAVNNTVSAKTLQEFVQSVKAQPGRIPYATAGIGSATHLAMAKFISRSGLDMLRIDYTGGGPAQAGLLGGQVAAYFGNTSELVPLVSAGKLRALAVASAARLPSLPGVPTVAESGYPGFRAELWVGIVGPTGMPDVVIDRVAAELAAAAGDKQFVERLRTISVDAAPRGTPAEFARFIDEEIRNWGELIRTAKIDGG